MSSDIYYTLNSSDCHSKESTAIRSITHSGEMQLSSAQLQSTPQNFKETRFYDHKKYKPHAVAVHYFIRGCLTLCSLSAMICLLSILLLHSMSSIWLDPVRNLKIKSEFVYVTLALATSSASLNFFSLGVFGIQIYLAYTNVITKERKVMLYLQNVSIIRFAASFTVFLSIPVFMASFSCYLYMEFRHSAAIIAISILAASSCFVIFAVFLSYLRWNQTCEVTKPKAYFKRKLTSETPNKKTLVGIENQSFTEEDGEIMNFKGQAKLPKCDVLKKFWETGSETSKSNQKKQISKESNKERSLPMTSNENNTKNEQKKNGIALTKALALHCKNKYLRQNSATQIPEPDCRKLKPSLSETVASQLDLECTTASTLV